MKSDKRARRVVIFVNKMFKIMMGKNTSVNRSWDAVPVIK
jgi:hypothetical protein